MITPKLFEILKIILGTILVIFPITVGAIYFLDKFGIELYLSDGYYSLNELLFDNQSPLFFGLCGIGGSILLNSVKIEPK